MNDPKQETTMITPPTGPTKITDDMLNAGIRALANGGPVKPGDAEMVRRILAAMPAAEPLDWPTATQNERIALLEGANKGMAEGMRRLVERVNQYGHQDEYPVVPPLELVVTDELVAHIGARHNIGPNWIRGILESVADYWNAQRVPAGDDLGDTSDVGRT